jgi:hypothetical protein
VWAILNTERSLAKEWPHPDWRPVVRLNNAKTIPSSGVWIASRDDRDLHVYGAVVL